MVHVRLRLQAALFAIGALASPALVAAWVADGTEVAAYSGHQRLPAAAPDGAGGVILAWTDSRNGSQSDIYAQRLDPQGAPLWTAGGIPICTASGNQGLPVVVSDAAGGAYIVWSDSRAGTFSPAEVYAQHVDASGATAYPANGALVAVGLEARAVADGAGGAFVVWTVSSTDIRLARLAPASVGVAITVCNAAQAQMAPSLVADGVGGVIVTWQDARGGVLNNDIYAQRFDVSGAAAWTANGVVVCGATSHQTAPAVTSDGAGGAIVAWVDERGGATTPDIYAQRLSPNGAALWTANGVAMASVAGAQTAPRICPDGAGGAIAAWVDGRGPNTDIYAQRVSAAGTVSWTLGGVPVCTATLNQTGVELVPDLIGGATLAWRDARAGAGLEDIYAQRLDPEGAMPWTVNGEPLCTAAGFQGEVALAADGVGGAIAAWADGRGADQDLRAQRVSHAGVVGPPGAGAWTANGIQVTGLVGVQSRATVASDGRGGAFFVWEDHGIAYPRLSLRRVSASGVPVWSQITLATGSAAQREPLALPDGRGGVFIVWIDERGADLDIYAQHLTEIGFVTAGWPSGGLALCADAGDQSRPRIVPDQVGGLIAVWEDRRSGAADIYGLRMTASGAVAAGWPAGGLALCAAPGDQLEPEVCSDGVGGAIVAWRDGRGADADIYAIRVTGAGAIAAGWPADGLALCAAGGDQTAPSVAADGVGGALVAWEDRRSGSPDLYVQRVTGSAAVAAGWVAGGVALATGPPEPLAPRLVTDGAAGAIVVWEQPGLEGVEILAGRLDAAGGVAPGWAANGLVLCGAPAGRSNAIAAPDGRGGVNVAWIDERHGGEDLYALRWQRTGVRDPLFDPHGSPMCLADGAQTEPAIAADGAGSAFIAWSDGRSDGDIYATHLLRASVPPPLSVAGADRGAAGAITAQPNPARGGVTIAFETIHSGVVRVDVLDMAGRRVRALAPGQPLAAGGHALRWDRRDANGASVPSGVYLVRVVAAGVTRSVRVVALD